MHVLIQVKLPVTVPLVIHSLCDGVFVRELVCHGVLTSSQQVARHARCVLSHLLELLAGSEKGEWEIKMRQEVMALLPYMEVSCMSADLAVMKNCNR